MKMNRMKKQKERKKERKREREREMNELINKTTDIRCIFRPAFGCCALQTLIETVIFSVFYAKKLKKARNLQQIFAKKLKNRIKY